MEYLKRYIAQWLALIAFMLVLAIGLIQGVPQFVAFFRALAGGILFYFVGKLVMGMFLKLLVENLSEFSSVKEKIENDE